MSNQTRCEQYSGGFPDTILPFQVLPDPRSGNAKRHYFGEILFIALCSIICQGEGFADMERFALRKEKWLKSFLKLPEGLPSNDTFRRIFTTLDPKKFNECFIEFARKISGDLPAQLIAIDGKTVRHSFDDADPSTSIHLISAWASESGISLGQLEVGKKKNEITEVPKLLRMLELKGHTITLDAMGCQKNIAQEIYHAQASYILALKGNHGNLHQDVEAFFNDPESWKYLKDKGSHFTSSVTESSGHGRVEKRTVLVTDAIDWIDPSERKKWLGLQSLVCVESERYLESTKETSVEKRYYLTSHPPNAEMLATMIRDHWSIENSLHWVLDVTWNEDQSRIRKGNAAQNVALLRKMALNILKNDTSLKDSIKGKRFQATLCEEALAKILKLKI